ncbi:MAG TPA: SDR family NAD(P)-dependent oxidoreductase, partial [Acidimicrobiales bacterium]
MVSLDGRVVAVTGAGRGMGAGIASVLAERGASLVLVDIRAGSAEATAGRVGNAVGVTGDVCDDAVIAEVLARAAERGGLDGWVNDAGIIDMASALATTQENFEAHLRVNLTAVFRCCQAAARWWREAGRP